MNVCLLNDSFPPVIDGVANVVLNYAQIMQKEELAEVAVATPKYPGADYASYPYAVIPYHSINTTRLVNGYRTGNPFAISELRELSEFSPDIIHSHCPFSSTVMARMLRYRTEAPIVFTYHTKFDIDIARAVKTKFLQKEAAKTIVDNIMACDEVWVVSQGAGENLKSLGYEGTYRIAPNGVDFDKGRVDDRMVAEATAGYDLPVDLPVFLFVGRIVKYKGIPLILKALSRLCADGADFRFVCIGSGPDEKEIKEMASRLLKPEQVIFTGAIHDRDALRAWNTRADLFLFPSTYDTNGIVVREAAACGLASVLIKGSCAAEGITDNRNGFLIEENADSLYDLLKGLGRNFDRMNDVGLHAMDEIYISWRDSVHAAHERYGELIEEKKAGKLVLRHHAFANTMLSFHEDFLCKYKKVHTQIGQFNREVSRLRRKMGQAGNDLIDEIREGTDWFWMDK